MRGRFVELVGVCREKRCRSTGRRSSMSLGLVQSGSSSVTWPMLSATGIGNGAYVPKAYHAREYARSELDKSNRLTTFHSGRPLCRGHLLLALFRIYCPQIISDVGRNAVTPGGRFELVGNPNASDDGDLWREIFKNHCQVRSTYLISVNKSDMTKIQKRRVL